MMTTSRQYGFTLLELLAAMALMGLLMLGVWSGLRTTSHAATHGRARVDRLDRVRGAGQFLRRDLTQARPIPWRNNAAGHAVVFSGDRHAMHFVAPLPGYLGRLGPQLQSLELVPNDDGTLRLQIRFALLPPDGSQPQPLGKAEVLADHIVKGRFDYRGPPRFTHKSTWRDSWKNANKLPALVRIRLETTQGPWPTLTAALPIDASAVNRASIRASAWRDQTP